MSCVVGIKQDGKVWIGADSTAGGSLTDTLSRECSKLYRCGQLLIGHTGSMRTAQLIRYVFELEEYDGKDDPIRYLVRSFVLPLRELLKEHGAVYDETENDRDNAAGDISSAYLLVGFAGRLFCFDGNFIIHEYADDYGAQGSGSMLALGVLYATSSEMSPEKRITLALEAAARFDSGNVGKPFLIESTEAL
jgi:ATP-dependent protease HslVU (ClpYQ) peptidase subunit